MPATRTQLSQAYPIGSRVDEDGRLQLGGCDAVELAREFGTPAYVVVEDDLRARAQTFVEAFKARTKDFDVLFATKAFPCTAIYRVLAEEGIACDVASGGELALALRGGFDPARIYMHGNAKSLDELRFAREAGVGHIVIDNADEIARLEAVVGDGAPQPVLLRVTPDVRGRTNDKISTGQADSKFGFSMADAPAAIARVQDSSHLDLVGLHMHIGSQILELEPFRLAIEAVAPLGDFGTYNLGGGLGVAYTAEQEPPRIADYVAAKVDTVNRVLGPGKRILDEPGRALVANSTVTLYTVQSVKRNVSTWVAVDGGMSDNLRPMLYGSVYEAQIADRFGGGTPSRLTGKHCESGDVIVREVELDDPRVGDIVVTPATGAYGHAMANNYNGVPRPPVIMVSPRRRPRGRTARDLRRSLCPRCRLRPAPAPPSARARSTGWACWATAPSARRSRPCSSSAPTTSPRSPACAREISGVLTRSRGDFDEILAGCDLVVELMGGLEPARDYVLRAMQSGRHVVTANKQLLSQHGEELWGAAREHGVQLRFEAAVAGVVPVIRVLQESLAGAHVDRVHGIVNGTTNYILTEMARTGCSYGDALADAQRLGYAEADPTDDVNGKDAAAKMAIIARLAFDTPVHIDQVTYEGIEQITADDMEYARELAPRPEAHRHR